MVLEKLQIIISFTTLLCEIVCEYPLAVPPPHQSVQFLIHILYFVSLRMEILSLKGLTKSTVHTGSEPVVSVLLDSLFVCLFESEMQSTVTVQ